MSFVFIGGLGCNHYYPQDFFEALGYPVQYLDLYSSKLAETLASPKNLREWFESQVNLSDDITIIAHSMGADFGVYLAAHYDAIQGIFLLDGGYLDMGEILPLDEEIKETVAYLRDQSYKSLEEVLAAEKKEASFWSSSLKKAVLYNWAFDEKAEVWKLSISEKLLRYLLPIRRAVFGKLNVLEDKKVTLILPKLSPDTPQWKREAVQCLPNFVTVIEMEEVSHQLYIEKPRELANIIRDNELA